MITKLFLSFWRFNSLSSAPSCHLGRCINVLLELIQTKVNYVVQEAIIVIKDIFRWVWSSNLCRGCW